MPAKGVFPTRENCDPTNRQEMFLWMFAALPGQNGGQFIMPIDYFRLVSERMAQLGAMLECPNCGHRNEPELEYVPPGSNDPNWATSAGKWVESGSVSDEEKLRRGVEALIALMGHSQKVEFYKALKAWESGTALPPTRGGQVVGRMVDDEPHLLPIALAVLRELHDAA